MSLAYLSLSLSRNLLILVIENLNFARVRILIYYCFALLQILNMKNKLMEDNTISLHHQRRRI